jgi:oxygen-dependent protoporphyrinogen oxidase
VALADATELLGIPLSADQIVDSDVVHWPAALPAPRPGHAEAVRQLRGDLRGHRLAIVGAAVAGSGLAAVVGDARREAAAVAESQTVAMIPSPTTANTPDPAAG